jgi:HAD superfamily hydrolase (TIGR01509 family)
LNNSSSLRAVIFDFDGLIMDTETATYEAWRDIYAGHGHALALETWAQCVGSDFGHYDPKADLEALLQRKLDWEPIHAKRREAVMQILSGYDALPGVRERLQEAEEMNLPCAVASSSPRWWVEHWLQHLGIEEVFQNVTCLEDTGKVKPDPSLFLHAAGKIGVPAEGIVILEDSFNGLRAALAAQMRCVVVPCHITRHYSFEGAWKQFTSLADFRLADLV